MSNLLYMDESNGNGVYATILNINSTNTNNTTAAATANMAGTTTAAAATATTTNNLNSIMNATATTANVAASTVGTSLPTSASNEDLSQSLSEYTDADESISAPTEFLAEFLSAVMLKDYKKALKYCKLILQYEPNNSTAKEFYPLILDKLRGAASSDSDENYNKSSSPELILELQCSDPSAGESDEAGSDEPQLGMSVDYTADDYGVPDDNYSGGTQSHDSHSSSNNCSEGLSLSESVESENDDDDEDGDVEEEEEDVMSSSGDDLPVDEPEQDNAPVDHNVSNLDNSGSHSSRNSSSGGGGRSRSDNTTHSYSSLLLEEEDDMVPANLQYSRNVYAADLDVSNGNKLPSASCSDSESPTEPLTQRLAAILRSKCGVSSTPDDDY